MLKVNTMNLFEKPRRLACALALMGLGAGMAPGAQAQETYPSRPIRIVVGASPGGGIDIVARELGQKITALTKQPVVVENRPGASTTIGGAAVAAAQPDGYTVFMASTSFAIAQALYKKLPYDAIKDFAPVTLVASGPLVLTVHPGNPARDLQELLAWAKTKPGKPSFGSAGPGTSVHLAGELLRLNMGLDYVHVPYKGGAPATQALMSGEVDMVFDVLTANLPQIKAGRVKAIAVTSQKRSPLLPDVPTLLESGYRDAEIAGWYGLLAPAATPKPIVASLHALVVKALADPDLRAKLAAQATDPIGSGPAEWTVYYRSELTRWAKVVTAAGVQPE